MRAGPAQGHDRRQGRQAGRQAHLHQPDRPWTTRWASKIGVDGTPAIYAADGTQLGGYLPPDEMLARLERAAARPVAAAR